MCRTAVFDMHFGHGIGASALFMYAPLVDTDARQHVRACPFHEVQIARVIDYARKIGVLKIDADSEIMPRAVKMALIGLGRGHRPTAYRKDSQTERGFGP